MGIKHSTEQQKSNRSRDRLDEELVLVNPDGTIQVLFTHHLFGATLNTFQIQSKLLYLKMTNG